MLRGEGLRAGIERFGEFANILFLKLISESEQIKRESGIPTKFDVACSWDSIKQIPISTRLSTNELLICNEMSINGLITEHRGYQTKLRDFKKSVSDHCLEMGYK